MSSVNRHIRNMFFSCLFLLLFFLLFFCYIFGDQERLNNFFFCQAFCSGYTVIYRNVLLKCCCKIKMLLNRAPHISVKLFLTNLFECHLQTMLSETIRNDCTCRLFPNICNHINCFFKVYSHRSDIIFIFKYTYIYVYQSSSVV